MAMLALFAIGLQLSISCSVQAETVPNLESYRVDKDTISVSGFSSGGVFAVQFHVAFSASIMGAGASYGAPYWCSQGNLTLAVTACITDPDSISIPVLVNFTNSIAAANASLIDDPWNLKGDRVFLYYGANDTSGVTPGVTLKLGDYYRNFVDSAAIFEELSIPSEHGMVTDDYGNPCDVIKPPYIVNCNYSLAYHFLQYIYGDIKPASSGAIIPENLLEFNQSQFFKGDPTAASMDSVGYVYVPTNCQKRSKCRLHVAFHGCSQGRVYLSDIYALHAGYNQLAEVNDIIVLYPQVINTTVPHNLYGCWDWLGYTSPSQFAFKVGAQMNGVKMMAEQIAADKVRHQTGVMPV